MKRANPLKQNKKARCKSSGLFVLPKGSKEVLELHEEASTSFESREVGIDGS